MKALAVTVLAVSFLCGCASAPRHALYDGAPVRAAPVEPVTTYTPRGAGLPEYWGAPDPKAEQSPHRRVLPQTPETMKEPGIWASDAPEGLPLLFGFPPLPPDEAAKDPDYVRSVTHCASMMGRSAVLMHVTDLIDELTDKERRCLSALSYKACAEEDAADAERESSPASGALRAVVKLAGDEASRACAGVNRARTEHLVFVIIGRYRDMVRDLRARPYR